MTQDDVIRLATQARLPHDYETQEPVWLDRLETFAKLVEEQSQKQDDYQRGYADAMNWKVQNHLEHLPVAHQQEPVGRFIHKEIEEAAHGIKE